MSLHGGTPWWPNWFLQLAVKSTKREQNLEWLMNACKYFPDNWPSVKPTLAVLYPPNLAPWLCYFVAICSIRRGLGQFCSAIQTHASETSCRKWVDIFGRVGVTFLGGLAWYLLATLLKKTTSPKQHFLLSIIKIPLKGFSEMSKPTNFL